METTLRKPNQSSKTMPNKPIASAKCKTFAISSGKGGVGKSSVALNLALSLSKMGAKVGLVDADTGLANINIMLGIQPKFTLADVISGEKSISDVVLKGPLGLSIIPSASGISEYAELNAAQLQTLASAIASLEAEFDYLLIDTAAGIHQGVCHFIRASHEAVIVITPEPTSLTDSFSLIKTLKNQEHQRTLRVLVNQCKDQDQAREVYLRLAGAVKKYLGSPIRYLGFLRSDEALRSAISLQRPVALYPSTDPSSRCFLRLAETLEKDSSAIEGGDHFSQYWQQLLQEQIDSQCEDVLEAHGQPQSLAQTPIKSAVKKQLAAAQANKPEDTLEYTASAAAPLGATGKQAHTEPTSGKRIKQRPVTTEAALEPAPLEKAELTLVEAHRQSTPDATPLTLEQEIKNKEEKGDTVNTGQEPKVSFEQQQAVLLERLQQRDKQQALHEFLTQLPPLDKGQDAL